MVIAELEKGEKSEFIERLRVRVDPTKMLWQNPLRFKFKLLGAITGLDFSVRAVASVAQIFEEDYCYFCSQNLLDLSKSSVLRVPVDSHTTDHLPAEYSYYWASEYLIATGENAVWYILFNAELSVGVLVVDSNVESATRRAVENAFKQHEPLNDPSDVFKEFRSEFARYGDIRRIENDFRSFVNSGS